MNAPLLNSAVNIRYTAVCSREINGRAVVAWSSPEPEDSDWDDFLQSTPLGQYQQSTLWARAKQAEGWRPIRIVARLDGNLVGGFQILARRTRFGAIGYVSKGPVVALEEEGFWDFMMNLLVAAVKDQRLQALVIQPPDRSVIDGNLLGRYGFLPNHLVSVNSATLVINTSRDMSEIKRGMRKTTQVELRQSEKRGIKIREGGEADLGTFFRLMTATCQRQQTSPSPATEGALREVWKGFHSGSRIRLSLAEYEGEPVAGAICLCFGERVTLWKKGWSGAHRERHPNQLVMFDAIQWSHEHGYKLFDSSAMNPETAVALLNNQPLTESQRNGRDFFLLGYGGTPVLLPKSSVYLNNLILKVLYRNLTVARWAGRMAKRLIRRAS